VFDGKSYLLQLRFKRVYKPYSVKLIKFTHESFVGTDMAKNFASKIQLVDPANGVDREVLVWMNHPLRYHNDTIYQQKFNRMVGGDEGTVLQIVNNTNWFMPYLAVVIGGLGLVIHFGMMLVNFLRKRSAANAKAAQLTLPKKGKNAARDTYTLEPSFPWKTVGPAIAVALGMVFIGCFFVAALIPRSTDSFDLDAFAKTPVNDEGRTMPLDSLARNYLKVIHGRQSFEMKVGDRTETISAVKWLSDVLARPDVAGDYPVFRVDNEDIKGMLGLNENEKFFSWNELFRDHPENPDKIQKQYEQVKKVPEKDRDAYQAKIFELYGHATTYMRLARGADYLDIYDLIAHPAKAEEFETKGRAILDLDPQQRTAEQRKVLERYESVKSALHELTRPEQDQDAARAETDPTKKQELEFEASNAEEERKLHDLYLAINPDTTIDPDNRGLGLGQAVLDSRKGVAIPSTVTAFFGVLTDYRDNRPADFNKDLAAYRQTLSQLDPITPVSTWVGSVYLPINRVTVRSSFEVFFNRFDPFTACWLLYIVVFLLVCTYSLAGRRDELARMTYGVICFATLFSFVGTILGGIWADQSWGRFWGWDPKENGAVLIVLWNALILHARWGGLVRDKGIAILAVFGNIVTCWSWFGTNMLGIGFHSYGFMGKALIILSGVVMLHLVLMAAGFFVPRAPRGPVPVIPVSSGAKAVTRAALAVLVLTFLVHTIGFVCRIYISGRPPVTNLYTSAVFIAWGAVALCIGLEVVFKNGIGSLTAAKVGFLSLLIADQLAHRDGDTMGQLQAVLATNFWLATHVVCVTLGYAATFLAGVLSVVFIVVNLIKRLTQTGINVVEA
jgi:ABC-type transport system involved in cytochrome c biogenesis permease subunit